MRQYFNFAIACSLITIEIKNEDSPVSFYDIYVK